MPDQSIENPLIKTFIQKYDTLCSSALGTLLEPAWLEQQLPLGIKSIQARNPDFSEAELHAAIFSAGVQKTLQWLDCGEDLIREVLEENAVSLN